MRWLLLLFLIGCVEAPIKPFGPDNPTLQDHVRYFEALYQIGEVVPVQAAAMNIHIQGSAVGCSSYGIQINDIYLRYANADEVEELVFHELGHCIFGREHTGPTYFMDGPMKGCLTSIMANGAPLAADTHWCYQRFKPYYIKELATPGKCLKEYALHGNCDRHYNANPKYFPSRRETMRFTYGNK